LLEQARNDLRIDDLAFVDRIFLAQCPDLQLAIIIAIVGTVDEMKIRNGRQRLGSASDVD